MSELASTYAFDPELVDLAAMVADVPPLTDPVQSRERTRQRAREWQGEAIRSASVTEGRGSWQRGRWCRGW
jgi:hypothetical protein